MLTFDPRTISTQVYSHLDVLKNNTNSSEHSEQKQTLGNLADSGSVKCGGAEPRVAKIGHDCKLNLFNDLPRKRLPQAAVDLVYMPAADEPSFRSLFSAFCWITPNARGVQRFEAVVVDKRFEGLIGMVVQAHDETTHHAGKLRAIAER